MSLFTRQHTKLRAACFPPHHRFSTSASITSFSTPQALPTPTKLCTSQTFSLDLMQIDKQNLRKSQRKAENCSEDIHSQDEQSGLSRNNCSTSVGRIVWQAYRGEGEKKRQVVGDVLVGYTRMSRIEVESFVVTIRKRLLRMKKIEWAGNYQVNKRHQNNILMQQQEL